MRPSIEPLTDITARLLPKRRTMRDRARFLRSSRWRLGFVYIRARVDCGYTAFPYLTAAVTLKGRT